MKKILIFVVMLGVVMCPIQSVMASEMISDEIIIQTEENESMMPYAADIRYRYKTVNGKLYRRLYNYTTNQWIGDWEAY